MYSGYLDLDNGTKHAHYWFIESENDPANRPVVAWFQGGPGASGMFGLLAENGPFTLNFGSQQKGIDVPELLYNPFGWHTVANMLFVEAPAGVGFSYCDDDCRWNDTTAATFNHELIQTFFRSYPEFQSNEFFVTGESYAGVYIPMLVREIVRDSKYINLKGFAVGNGCIGTEAYGGCGKDRKKLFVDFMHGHGEFSTATYRAIQEVCGDDLREGTYSSNAKCAALLDTMQTEIGGYYAYDLYDNCPHTGSFMGSTRHVGSLTYPSTPNKCGGEVITSRWLNLPEVKQALHVHQNITWIERDGWDHYTRSEKDVRPIYKELAGKYRTLIFYGDLDPGVPYNGGEEWTSSMGFELVRPWRPWTVDGATQMAGHVVHYADSFDFLTIRASGHMVPQYKPAAGLSMLAHWLRNESWPEYSPYQPPRAPSAALATARRGSADLATRRKLEQEIIQLRQQLAALD